MTAIETKLEAIYARISIAQNASDTAREIEDILTFRSLQKQIAELKLEARSIEAERFAPQALVL